MKTSLLLCLGLLLGLLRLNAQDDFPPGPDSLPQLGVPRGEMLKDSHTADEKSVFPGTGRDYQIYLPPGHDKSKPAPFMVFQDGVIYQAPVVFDNLIAKKDIPPLVGIFIKPGVVPAANDNALPRFNRSYEYDSVTDTYARFLIDEFLPAVEKKHGIKLSTDPNDTAIAGNSSGGICAFMAAWHRPDRFRRVFTGVGTYVGIHGADQLPVLVRKFEPKPLRVFLQSGENDNNLYCGDWWMANQMMERSLTWAGYDVNHAWGTGGHNQKHATQVFPDAVRWLWRDWQTNKEVKANPRGESKWRGYEVVGEGQWETATNGMRRAASLTSNRYGDVFAIDLDKGEFWALPTGAAPKRFGAGHTADDHGLPFSQLVTTKEGQLIGTGLNNRDGLAIIAPDGKVTPINASSGLPGWALCLSHDGWFYLSNPLHKTISVFRKTTDPEQVGEPVQINVKGNAARIALSPDQTQLFAVSDDERSIHVFSMDAKHLLTQEQQFAYLDLDSEGAASADGLCVDTNGWLYVATSLGIQVCDQAGRVNFIIPTPKQPHDVCLGGKDLSELFIACGDAIYKRPTKARGYISGQMAPIKPAPPKL